jgi:hypothetical protein
MNAFFLALAALLLMSCAPPPEPADSIPPAAAGEPETVVGIVRIVGSAPVNVQVVLEPQAGRSIRLTGPLVGELRRLAGVEVAVHGRLGRSPDPIVDRQLEAAGYEIVAVDGRSVVMGEIVSLAGGRAELRTDSGQVVTLSGVPQEFRVGQKVWVQGPQSLTVQSYGLIRP